MQNNSANHYKDLWSKNSVSTSEGTEFLQGKKVKITVYSNKPSDRAFKNFIKTSLDIMDEIEMNVAS